MDTLKILVVDDEARMRKLVKDFLTNKGFAVIEAGDGEEAVDVFFAQKDIALVLLDVMMPKMDGWEVLRTIRKYSQVPVIREKILNNVWNYDYFGDARTIDTHVKKLRSKMGEKGEYIKTIWGMGYKFEVSEG